MCYFFSSIGVLLQYEGAISTLFQISWCLKLIMCVDYADVFGMCKYNIAYY